MLLDEQTITRLRSVLADTVIFLDTPDALGAYVSSRWTHLEQQGPKAYQPVRATFVETPWAPQVENLYVALYPTTAVENLLDFKLLVSYTSSIQQDLIALGEIDLQYFYSEDIDTIISGTPEGLANADYLVDHDTIIKRLETFDLPQDVQWMTELRYKSALVWGGGDLEIEFIAATDKGFLLLFTVNG